jgi:hypothetical protein
MPHKADPTVICQCCAIISKYYRHKHLQTAKHTRDMSDREHIEVAEAWKYKPRNNKKGLKNI